MGLLENLKIKKPKRDESPLMQELRRLSEVCGNVDISGRRQAKKQVMREKSLSGRQLVKLRKRTNRFLKAQLRAMAATQQEAITPDPVTPTHEAFVENAAD